MDFGVHLTNKIHIISEHFGDYIKLTGRAIGHASGQTIEAAHAAMNKRMEQSNYWVKDMLSDVHGDKMHKILYYISIVSMCRWFLFIINYVSYFQFIQFF